MADHPKTSSVPENGKSWIHRWRWTALLTLPACALIGLGVAAYQKEAELPRYEALATLEISEEREPDLASWSSLKEVEWLSKQADELKIASQWGMRPSEAAARLAESLVIRRSPSSVVTRFQLGYSSVDSVEAAAMTNALVDRWLQDDGGDSSGTYTGRVVMQINAEVFDWRIFGEGQRSGRQSIPEDFIETELKVIGSKETLTKVVEVLKLDERWGVARSAAYEKVRQGLVTRREENTSLIVIEYTDDDPQWASNVANEIAHSYQKRRVSLDLNRSNDVLDTLRRQLKNQSDKVEEARLRMLDIAERYRIIDLAAMENRASVTGDPVTGVGTILMTSMHDTYKAEASIAQIKIQIENISGLEGDFLMSAAAMLDIDDPIIAATLPEYRKLKIQRDALMANGVGEGHSDLKPINEKLQQHRALLEESVKTIRQVLRTKMDMASQALALAKEIEEGKKDDSMDERHKVAEYSEASKEYELQKNMLANMQAKFATEQVDLTMPKTPITMHEIAEVQEAASPIDKSVSVVSWAMPTTQAVAKVWLPALLWGAGLGLLAGLILMVPVMRVYEAAFG